MGSSVSNAEYMGKELCKDALEVQRNRIKEKRGIVKEQKIKVAEKQKLECEWRGTLEVLSEQRDKQKSDLEERAKAHKRVILETRRGVKLNLETRLGTLCNQIVEKDREID